MPHRFTYAALLSVALGALLLAGCGSQGYAAPLGKNAHATLSAPGAHAPAGSASLLREYATHITVYYPSSTQVPYSTPATPVQLRAQSCDGPVLAALTAGAPGPSGTAPLVRADPAGGVFVALAQSQVQYVAILARANDAPATVLACGHPLSGRKQFFDLYPPSVGSNGYGRGIALMEPIVATAITISLRAPQPYGANWTLRTGSCAGQVLASGSIAAHASAGAGEIFSAQGGDSWWLAVAPGGADTSGALCGQVVS